MMINKIRQHPCNLIPPVIWHYWTTKYGPYLYSYISGDIVIFCENGLLDCFHPTGDRLARHITSTGQTLYFWKNDVKHPLTEQQYLDKLCVCGSIDIGKTA